MAEKVGFLRARFDGIIKSMKLLGREKVEKKAALMMKRQALLRFGRFSRGASEAGENVRK